VGFWVVLAILVVALVGIVLWQMDMLASHNSDATGDVESAPDLTGEQASAAHVRSSG
jgi:hypothetical protein